MRRIVILIFCGFIMGCEDIVEVDVKDAPPAIVIDAWINDKRETQTIKISSTQGYYDNNEPIGIPGAEVVITDSKGGVFEFRDTFNGDYVWNPSASNFEIEDYGTTYNLEIRLNGTTYTATSSLNRVPNVDSIKFTFKEEQSVFQPAGYYAEFVATDFKGPGDTYWIKAFKNGALLNNPFDLNIAYDAGFNAGGNIDGFVFIQPIQDGVTPLNDELDAIDPYVLGDSLYVEIHSITNEAFYFLQEVQIQTQRDGGFDEVFAEPFQNVGTNITAQSTNGEAKVVGFFNVSSVSGRGMKLVE
jgi:hypothetical protein